MIALFTFRTRPGSALVNPDPSAEPLSLLFDDGVLHHANPQALHKFVLQPGIHVWEDLRETLVARFPDFPVTAGTGPAGSVKIQSKEPNDPTLVEMNWRESLCWVEMRTEGNGIGTDSVPVQCNASVRSCNTSDHATWEIDKDGAITWTNNAFDRLVEKFELSDPRSLVDAVTDDAETQRVLLEHPDGIPEWYELTAWPHADGKTFHATRVTALAKAEEDQRGFVQTLAKTFAHLPIGLAIFDDRGQLTIFNPALVDLTGLQASFLATQPSMIAFFDALRESRQMPEPKNYRTWRQDITDMIAAASGGQYRETWTLEDGRTYAVQGRPHPDGATAFLIEDISAEVTLTRSYRAEVEKFEIMLDHVSDALVVFSGTGVLTFCNVSYRELFRQNPEAAFADVTLNDAMQRWDERLGTKTDWRRVTEFVAATGLHSTRHFDMEIKSESMTLHCDLRALAGQGTLIRFCVTHDTARQEPDERLIERN